MTQMSLLRQGVIKQPKPKPISLGDHPANSPSISEPYLMKEKGHSELEGMRPLSMALANKLMVHKRSYVNFEFLNP